MKDFYKAVSLWIIKLGLFVVPFVPLYIASSLFFPYITGKAFLFRFVVELVFAAWLFLALFYKEYRPKKNVLLWAMLFFVAVVSLATVFGANPFKSFWSNFERMEGLLAYLHLVAFFVVLASVFKKDDWLTYFNFYVFAGLIESFYAFSQRLGYLASPQGGFRVDGTIGNPTYLAAYLLFVVGICLLLIFEETSKHLKIITGASLGALIVFLIHFLQSTPGNFIDLIKGNPMFGYALLFFLIVFVSSFWVPHHSRFWKFLYALIGLLSLLTIYFTASRGPVLSLLLGLFLAGFLYIFIAPNKRPEIKKYKIRIAAVLGILVILPFSLWLFRSSSFIRNNSVLSRLTSISLTERTTASRFIIWSMSWQGFKERPILGWGPDNYGIVFSKFYRTDLWQQEPWFDRSHNIVFDWLINAGLLGLVAYFGILISGIYVLWSYYFQVKAKQAEARHLFGALRVAILFSVLFFVYVVQNLFVFDQIATYLGFFSVLGYIVTLYHSHNEASSLTTAPSFAVLRPGVIVILIALLGATTYFLNAKPLLANQSLLRALRLSGAGDWQGALNSYHEALAYKTLGLTEVREQLVQYTLGAVRSSQPQSFKESVFNEAIQEAQKNVEANSLDPRAYSFLGILFTQGGQYDQAIQTFTKAIEISPTKHQLYFSLADAHIGKKDYAGAVKVMETIYNRYPVFDAVGMNLVVTYVLNNQQDKADALLKDRFGTVDVADPLLLQVYRGKPDYQRFLGVSLAFVKQNGENADYRKGLAQAYFLDYKNRTSDRGELQKAIQELREAIRLEPSFKASGEGMIGELQRQ